MVTIRTDGRVGDISQGDAARTSIMSEETGRLHVGEELGVTACLSPARRVVAKVVDATRVPATRDSELARLLRVSQDANCNWHGQSLEDESSDTSTCGGGFIHHAYLYL